MQKERECKSPSAGFAALPWTTSGDGTTTYSTSNGYLVTYTFTHTFTSSSATYRIHPERR